MDGWTEGRKEEQEGREEGRKEMGWEGKEAKEEEGVKFVGKDRGGSHLPVSFRLRVHYHCRDQGVIDACAKLTGMPDLTLSFMVKSWARKEI